MPGENQSPDVQAVIGTIAEASVRHTEYLDIDTMSVGEPGSSESAQSQPIIRIEIEQPLPGDRDSVRLGTVTARPLYDSDDGSDGPLTERDLQETLTGYQVRVELRTINGQKAWSPFGIDYDALGFVEAGEDTRGVHDFRAYTEPMPFTDAVDLVDETMSTLRTHREQ